MKQKFFRLAKMISRLSDHAQHRIGAVVVKKNRVISLGCNKMKTNPKSNHPFHYHHAELDAILNTRTSDLSKCSIYVYRENKQGEVSCSKPCKSCQKLIKFYQLKVVYYSDYDNFKSYKVA